MDKMEEFWELVGIRPNKKFRLKNEFRTTKHVFIFDVVGNIRDVDTNEISPNHSFYDILIGRDEIIPILDMTDKDKLTIKYLKENTPMKWIAKDKNGIVYSYTLKPYKKECENVWIEPCGGTTTKIFGDFQFLNWEDKEPYEII